MTDPTIKPLTMNFGPQHPAAHGVLRLVLKWTVRLLKGLTRISGFASWHDCR